MTFGRPNSATGYFVVLMVLSATVLCSCVSTETTPVVNDADVMLFLEPGLQPEPLQFPEYLLMEDFELEAHGRIPGSTLIGIGLKSKLALNKVLPRYNDMLTNKGWSIGKAEMSSQSFRLLASKKDETLEIRAVQGTRLTQIFILYKPSITIPEG